jgi:peptidyl-tRNA hydrolase, PTH1 family
MNLSGLSVAALLNELELGVEDLIVLYDELAIPLGTIRIREHGSAAGHNGVKSISGVLGTEEWTRIRIGIGKPPTETGGIVKSGGKDFLLTPMRKQALGELDESLDQAVRAVEAVLTKGVGAAMNEFNRKIEPGSENGI